MRVAAALFVLLLRSGSTAAQEYFTEYEVQPKGGKAQFEQVLETQLHLPQILLTKDFAANIKTNFTIDSTGAAREIVFDGTANNALRNELRRIMGFYRFQKTSLNLTFPQPYYMVFSLSTGKYKHYIKQRVTAKLRNDLPADSTMVVYSRADRSPEYYRNGEEGLADYILSDIRYPAAARERSVQGTVVVEFVVETNGFVTCVEPKTLVAAGCTDEALRLIRETKWQPAVLGGKKVRYRMSYPITFTLEDQVRNVGP